MINHDATGLRCQECDLISRFCIPETQASTSQQLTTVAAEARDGTQNSDWI